MEVLHSKRALKELLGPYDAALMKGYPVSTRVNFVKNDDPQCVAALQGASAGSS